MKNLLYLLVLSMLLSGCGLIGGSKKKNNRKGFEAPPVGMILIKSGAFTMGTSDEDMLSSFNATPKVVTVPSFWMKETEVTNSEYREFVYWVIDSIRMVKLGEQLPEKFQINEDEYGEPLDNPRINWRATVRMKDEGERMAYRDVMKEMSYTEEESLLGKQEIDTRRLAYMYEWIDYRQAAKAKYDPRTGKYAGTVTDLNGMTKEIENRGDFIMRDTTYIYPDTLCWVRDFDFSYNDPQTISYFSHPSYDDYPVVGVTWKQAKAFTHWKSNHAVTKKYRRQYSSTAAYRLPTETEWEYAARGGFHMSLYPWGSPYTTNKEGCYLANFKPQRGDYALDGGALTTKVGTYDPNEYGLYDMAGNVAEWTENAFSESAYNFYHDMSPIYSHNVISDDPLVFTRKVIRGGSWKDISFFIQCGTRTFEFQDSCKSYIGFRYVKDVLGSDRY